MWPNSILPGKNSVPTTIPAGPKTAKSLLGVLSVMALTACGLAAQETAPLPYEQKTDVIYGEAHGTGLLMDVFTPKPKTNGLGIIDVASGAYRPTAARFATTPWPGCTSVAVALYLRNADNR